MAREPKQPKKTTTVDALTHDEESRTNLPTPELQPMMSDEDKRPIPVIYQRRNRDLDPQLVWRGKDEQDEKDLVVPALPLYIQEKVHPKALIHDLLQTSKQHTGDDAETTPDLFADFNGLAPEADRTEFYRHDQNWSNRMILGDSLQVMSSLAEREGLRGKVQCIYIDPPYGIKFNSNFQWSTTSRDVKDGKREHITREPEQVKAFRDTWRDGIHSYLTYLRDRLTVARDLLAESGSIFVQIGDENVHHVRTLMDEVFGAENSYATIIFKKKGFTAQGHAIHDCIVWYSKNKPKTKLRTLYESIPSEHEFPTDPMFSYLMMPDGSLKKSRNKQEAKELMANSGEYCRLQDRVISQHPSKTRSGDYMFHGQKINPGSNAQWAFDPEVAIPRLEKAGRLHLSKGGRLEAIVFWRDMPRKRITNLWDDTVGAFSPIYVVQTSLKVIQRCILMTTDPGDLVLDPTCGSGTTAYVAEQWGRRWITIDTSRVALALARARIMGARYPYYLLADSREGQAKEREITGAPPPPRKCPTRVRQHSPGFCLPARAAHHPQVDCQ